MDAAYRARRATYDTLTLELANVSTPRPHQCQRSEKTIVVAKPFLPDLGLIALTAARAGAAAIHSVVETGQLGTQFKSGGHDMVTAADKASERAVIDAIHSARPADSIIGEEGGVHQGTSGIRWLVDPLDGTANFVYGRADYAVSVGAELAGEPCAGAIIRPADGQWIMAGSSGVSSGQDPRPARGRTVHRAPAVRQCSLDDALVAFGLPYSLPARRRALTVIASLVPRLWSSGHRFRSK
jgi:myo-inositol-1(or 4)-monophosphatase